MSFSVSKTLRWAEKKTPLRAGPGEVSPVVLWQATGRTKATAADIM
jgi:hypothetical protein